MTYHQVKRELIKEVLSNHTDLTESQVFHGYRELDARLQSEESVIFLLIHGNPRTSIGNASKKFNQTLREAIRTNQYDSILKILVDLDFKKELFPEHSQHRYNIEFYHQVYQFFQKMFRYPQIYWNQSKYRLIEFSPRLFISYLNQKVKRSYYDLFLEECDQKGIDLIDWGESIDAEPGEKDSLPLEHDPWHNY